MINNKITELQELSNYLTNKEKISFVKIEIKDTLRGTARYYTRKITIPEWATSREIEFLYYYLIHEVTHFIVGDYHLGYGHGKEFKKVEKRLLQEFGLIPIYKKVYPRELRNLNGETVYQRTTSKG